MFVWTHHSWPCSLHFCWWAGNGGSWGTVATGCTGLLQEWRWSPRGVATSYGCPWLIPFQKSEIRPYTCQMSQLLPRRIISRLSLLQYWSKATGTVTIHQPVQWGCREQCPAGGGCPGLLVGQLERPHPRTLAQSLWRDRSRGLPQNGQRSAFPKSSPSLKSPSGWLR